MLLPCCADDVVSGESSSTSTTGEELTDIATVTGASFPDPTSGPDTDETTADPVCAALDDCPDDPCRPAVACAAGTCVREAMPEGTVLADQVDGDCVTRECDADGGVRERPDGADLPADDGVACTDETCDGVTPVHSPRSEPCYSGPDNTRGVGLCVDGTRTCDLETGDWGACLGEVTPTFENCDAEHLDEDCDGQVDESGPSCKCGDGSISTGEQCDDGNISDADACTSQCAAQEVLALAHGGRHACAVLSNSRVKCWGDGDNGATGQGDTLDRGDGPLEMGQHLPVVVLDPSRIPRSLAAGYLHTCVVFTDGALKCWGRNDTGQLGLGDKHHRGDEAGEMGVALPLIGLGIGQTVAAVTAGLGFTCALLNAGTVKCWGDNPFGQLGLGDTFDRGDDPNEMGNALPPVALGGKTALAVSAGTLHACVLLDGGEVKCWGANFSGVLGQGDTQHRGDSPGEMGPNLAPVDLGGPATAVAAGSAHTCALLDGGAVKCWGSNQHGQLGQGDTLTRGDNSGEMGPSLLAVDLGADAVAVAITAGGDFNCALLASGAVKCWGRNHNGQLGLGSTLNFGDQFGEMGDNLSTVDLGPGVSARAIDAPASGGAFIACASLDDRSVKCWGTGTLGSLGLGDTANRGDQFGEMGANLPRPRLFSSVW